MPKNQDLAHRLATVASAIECMRKGEMVILVDDSGRENEGDMIVAAEKITPSIMNFMIQHGSGIVCLPMDPALLDRLQIPMMVDENSSRFATPFTVSIEAKEGVSTGVSAADRTKTVLAAVADGASLADLSMPGHIFPLRARQGGVLQRQGHTEGGVDLARLAGLKPCAVICEVMQADGEMSRGESLQAFAKAHGIPVVQMQDLIAYRYHKESVLDEVASARMPMAPHGEFTVKVFKSRYDDQEHVALMCGDVTSEASVLVRLHSECLTGDVFHSKRCDCGEQLQQALHRLSVEGGVLLYLRQEGRGIGLANKIKAYALQDTGMDTVEANHALGFGADQRDYHLAAQVLLKLGLRDIRLLTNNPAKVKAMEAAGLRVVAREGLETRPHVDNIRYLDTKRQKLGHVLSAVPSAKAVASEVVSAGD